MGIDGQTIKGYIALDQIVAFRKHSNDPNWTIIYTVDHRVFSIYEKYDCFCERLKALDYD